MAINTTLAGLSTNPALNGPDGSTDLPSQLDDAIRYALSFTAQLRDGLGFSAGAVLAGLGYTPVQQGTGTLQLANVVKIGWSAASKLRLQIDATDYAAVWPIDISGNAASASNAGAIGGITLADLVRRNSPDDIRVGWTGSTVVVTVNGTAQNVLTTWGAIAGRPTALSQLTNDVGYQVASQVSSAISDYAVQRIDSVKQLGNTGTSAMRAFFTDGSVWGWPITASDARLKENIVDSTEDSLAKVLRIRFRSFNFRAGHDDGRTHKTGVIAQELEEVDPHWVNSDCTYKAPEQYALLMAALQSIQQQQVHIRALEARVAALEEKA